MHLRISKNFILTGAFLLSVCGCAPSFRELTTISLLPSYDLKEKIFLIADAIAEEHGLRLDQTTRESKIKRGYFGPPYHYYSVELKEGTEVTVVEYAHEGRMTSKYNQRREPEKKFIESLKASLKNQIK